MNQAFTYQLVVKVCKTDVGTQKIDGTILETHAIVVSAFSMSNKDNREKIFEESFLLTDVKPDIVFGMLFLTMSNVNVDFQAWDL